MSFWKDLTEELKRRAWANRMIFMFSALCFAMALSISVVDTISIQKDAIVVMEQQHEFAHTTLQEYIQRDAMLLKYNIPLQYYNVLYEACVQDGVDVEFMIKLMYTESRFDKDAQSRAKAYGLMQVQYPTATDVDSTLVSHWQLFDPERNIRIGVRYFKMLLDRYNGDYRLAAIAYNRGPTRLDRELLNGRIIDWYHDRVMKAGEAG